MLLKTFISPTRLACLYRTNGFYTSTARSSSTASAHWQRSWHSVDLAASDQLTQSKSVFQAYATALTVPSSFETSGDTTPTPISSVVKGDVVPGLLAHIHSVEPRTRRASHAMYAWRVRDPNSARSGHLTSISNTILYGSSNGGEAGAGERLERLLELSKCEDVIVIVFRWYGGVKLGSDRWKCISTVAKEALERGGFLPSRGAFQGQGSPAGRAGKRRR